MNFERQAVSLPMRGGGCLAGWPRAMSGHPTFPRRGTPAHGIDGRVHGPRREIAGAFPIREVSK